MNLEREFPLSKNSLLYMKTLATRTGIDLNNYNEDAIYNRLVNRLRLLKIPDFDVYVQRLKSDLEEEIKFIDLLSNLTTFFFRENYHFEYLAKILLPELLAKKKKIRIWCAGCATGEEAYSIAIVIHEVIPDIKNYDIKILATDINSHALRKASAGIYKINRIKKISHLRQKIWFTHLGDKNSTLVKINDKLKKLITFRQLNLMDIWPMHGPFDVIFCRNVLMYFKDDIRCQVLVKFHKLLDMGGVLFLGYSEHLYSQKKHYLSLGKTIYKKILPNK